MAGKSSIISYPFEQEFFFTFEYLQQSFTNFFIYSYGFDRFSMSYFVDSGVK